MCVLVSLNPSHHAGRRTELGLGVVVDMSGFGSSRDRATAPHSSPDSSAMCVTWDRIVPGNRWFLNVLRFPPQPPTTGPGTARHGLGQKALHGVGEAADAMAHGTGAGNNPSWRLFPLDHCHVLEAFNALCKSRLSIIAISCPEPAFADCIKHPPFFLALI